MGKGSESHGSVVVSDVSADDIDAVIGAIEGLDLDDEFRAALNYVLAAFSAHQPLAVTHAGDLLTTQEVGDLLAVSRQSVVKLCDKGALKFEETEGGHRRIQRSDVLRYQEERASKRKEFFAESAEAAETLGSYEAERKGDFSDQIRTR